PTDGARSRSECRPWAVPPAGGSVVVRSVAPAYHLFACRGQPLSGRRPANRIRPSSEGTDMDIVQSAPFDLLLRGGRVIDPAQGLDGILDVAVREGRIAPVGRHLAGPARAAGGGPGQLLLPRPIGNPPHLRRHARRP